MTIAASPSIVGLFLSCRPTAITGRIPLVVVHAIKCVADRPVAHVFKEAFKAIPPLANRDSAPAVIIVSGIAWVKASAAHLGPDLIFGRFGLSVRSVARYEYFAIKAAATSTAAILQCFSVNAILGPAGAATQPSNVRMSIGECSVRSAPDNEPSPDPLAGQVRFQWGELVVVPRNKPDGLTSHVPSAKSSLRGDWCWKAAATFTQHAPKYTPVLWRGGTARAEEYTP